MVVLLPRKLSWILPRLFSVKLTMLVSCGVYWLKICFWLVLSARIKGCKYFRHTKQFHYFFLFFLFPFVMRHHSGFLASKLNCSFVREFCFFIFRRPAVELRFMNCTVWHGTLPIGFGFYLKPSNFSLFIGFGIYLLASDIIYWLWDLLSGLELYLLAVGFTYSL